MEVWEWSWLMRVGIIGAGVVGAAIAYELSQLPGLNITVFDQRAPQTWAATGAALGVLVVAASSRPSGRHLQLRLASLQRYETLIPELEAQTRQSIPYNRQGILELCFDPQSWQQWQQLQPVRQQQGLNLQLLSPEQVWAAYPQLRATRSPGNSYELIGGIYSPQDRQVQPLPLTLALIQAAKSRGVNFIWQTPIQTLRYQSSSRQPAAQQATTLVTPDRDWPIDWLVIAAGIGSHWLTAELGATVALQPVLGQGLEVTCPDALPLNCPVIQSEDVHLVPISPQRLWIGATVEFPAPEQPQVPPSADPNHLQRVWQQATRLCPALAEATIQRTWSGLRPRPQGRSAPVIEPLTGYNNVLLASGHYRNGILLAPVTALQIRDWMAAALGESLGE